MASKRTAEWQKANPEKTKRNRAKTWAQYYANHRTELIAKATERARGSEAKRARDSARYARTRGASNAELFTLDEIYERDEAICHLCDDWVDRADASMDHVIPVSLGGSHARANVKLAHIPCNSSRKQMPVDEWRASRGIAA